MNSYPSVLDATGLCFGVVVARFNHLICVRLLEACTEELMARGVGAYSPDVAMQVEIRQLVAEGEWVCAQIELSAATRDGRPYCNRYHIAFRLRAGRIVEVNEFVDTRYVYEMLGL